MTSSEISVASGGSSKPKFYTFEQQIMKGWHVQPTLKKALVLFAVIGLLFIGLGVIVLIRTENIVQFSQRYDNSCNLGQKCSYNIDIPEDMGS